MNIYKSPSVVWRYITDASGNKHRIISHLSSAPIIEIGEPVGCMRKWSLGGEDYVKVKFSLQTPVNFTTGDFVMYKGQGYVLTKPYKPSYNTNTGGYDYDMQFDAYYKILANSTAMLTIQENAEYRRVGTNWKYTENLANHIARLNENIREEELYMPLGEPTVVRGDYQFGGKILSINFIHDDFRKKSARKGVDGNDEDTFICDEHKFISYEGVDVMSAINTLCSEENYNCEWWYDEETSTILLGKCGGLKDHEQREKTRGVIISSPTGTMGDKEAEKISVNTSDKDYYTRLRLFGSTKNIPETYNKHLLLSYNPTERGGDVVVWPKSNSIDVPVIVPAVDGERGEAGFTEEIVLDKPSTTVNCKVNAVSLNMNDTSFGRVFVSVYVEYLTEGEWKKFQEEKNIAYYDRSTSGYTYYDPVTFALTSKTPIERIRVAAFWKTAIQNHGSYVYDSLDVKYSETTQYIRVTTTDSKEKEITISDPSLLGRTGTPTLPNTKERVGIETEIPLYHGDKYKCVLQPHSLSHLSVNLKSRYEKIPELYARFQYRVGEEWRDAGESQKVASYNTEEDSWQTYAIESEFTEEKYISGFRAVCQWKTDDESVLTGTSEMIKFTLEIIPVSSGLYWQFKNAAETKVVKTPLNMWEYKTIEKEIDTTVETQQVLTSASSLEIEGYEGKSEYSERINVKISSSNKNTITCKIEPKNLMIEGEPHTSAQLHIEVRCLSGGVWRKTTSREPIAVYEVTHDREGWDGQWKNQKTLEYTINSNYNIEAIRIGAFWRTDDGGKIKYLTSTHNFQVSAIDNSGNPVVLMPSPLKCTLGQVHGKIEGEPQEYEGTPIAINLTPGQYKFKLDPTFLSVNYSQESEDPVLMAKLQFQSRGSGEWKGNEGMREIASYSMMNKTWTKTTLESSIEPLEKVSALRLVCCWKSKDEEESLNIDFNNSQSFALELKSADYGTATVRLQQVDRNTMRRTQTYRELTINGTTGSSRELTADFIWNEGYGIPAEGELLIPEKINQSHKDWTSDLYENIDDIAQYGTSITEIRLQMANKGGGAVEYVDAAGYEDLSQYQIVEKVEVDEEFYPSVTMRNDRTQTLYELKNDGRKRPEGNTTDMFEVKTEYNDGSYKKEYYEYYVLGDTLNTGILDIEKGITTDWLLPGETMKVHFNTGQLAGMEFEATIEYKSGEKPYRQISVIPNDSYGQFLPNDKLFPQENDEYVIIGWNPKNITSIDVIENAGYALYLEAVERVNNAVRDHNTYQVNMMANSVLEKKYYRLSDSRDNPIKDKDSYDILTDEFYYEDTGILKKGEGVRLTDLGYFTKTFSDEDSSIPHCSELLRVVGIEHPLDMPYDKLTYTIGETSVLKGTLNTLKKAINTRI